MEKFFEIYALPELTHKETKKISISLNVKEIEFVITTFSQRKLQIQIISLMNSPNHLRRKKSVKHKLFSEIEEERTYSHSFFTRPAYPCY